MPVCTFFDNHIVWLRHRLVISLSQSWCWQVRQVQAALGKEQGLSEQLRKEVSSISSDSATKVCPQLPPNLHARSHNDAGPRS